MVVRRKLEIKGRATVFITTTVLNFMPLFRNAACAKAVLRQFSETAEYFNIAVVAYALMPSHVHALLGFNRVENMPRMMQSFKSLSSRALKELIPAELVNSFKTRTGYTLWKPRYDDFIVWSAKQFSIKTEYIHNNPVKAGLVADATAYPYSSARDWMLNESGLVKIDKDWTWTGRGMV